MAKADLLSPDAKHDAKAVADDTRVQRALQAFSISM